MKKRILNCPDRQSWFLFGARGTGKSTLLRKIFKSINHFYIDLLDPILERKYMLEPNLLSKEVLALAIDVEWIIIDEVQKIPGLLDVVHGLIEKTSKKFVLTGSSARKLKHGNANLLAGRALVRSLYPFTFTEVGKPFDLISTLSYGLLPQLSSMDNPDAKSDFLRSYTHLYLKEEIWAEHLIRKLEPFRYFLEVAAQCNGKIINALNLSRDVGVSDKSIAQYFSILEDTLLGFHLHAFKCSFWKKLIQKPRFYFIDTGIVRALSRTLSQPLTAGSYEFGNIFEQFILVECYKLCQYNWPDYRLSYFRTADGVEVDLVVERPGQPLLLIEIKSISDVQEKHVAPLSKIALELESVSHHGVESICLANIDRPRQLGAVRVIPWQQGIKKYFGK